jgi:hypothetical protein
MCDVVLILSESLCFENPEIRETRTGYARIPKLGIANAELDRGETPTTLTTPGFEVLSAVNSKAYDFLLWTPGSQALNSMETFQIVCYIYMVGNQ